MANAIHHIIDRGRKGVILNEMFLCASHLATEAPHNLTELEVVELPADTSRRCDFENKEREQPWDNWQECGA